ncbi:MAG: DUF882 domain-containing protein [Deltaproteobacteria bacterium]|nr:MAG: DUF882 domain-containing protein [Deltaproteobacteria bacterium]
MLHPHRQRPYTRILLAASLTWAAAICGPQARATSPGAARSATTAPRTRAPLVLWIERLGTGRAVRVRVADGHGRIDYAALPVLRELFRDVRSGRDHPVHFRLAWVLARLSAAFPAHPVILVSGYRNHSRSAKKSRHLRGRAADVRIPGVPNRVVVEWLRRNLRGIGVGYYPNSSFVHVDVRRHDALWVDYAGPGEPPCYDPNPVRAFRSGEADRLSRSEARRRCASRGR